MRAYLDHNATTPLVLAARDAMVEALAHVGNASAVHGGGRAAKARIEQARGAVASLVGAGARNLIFTSGGTEANNLALGPGVRRDGEQPCGRLIVSAIEHPSVLAGHRFGPEAVCVLPVTHDGLVDLATLDALLEPDPRPLVSVMLANNETGAIQPVAELAARVHARGGLVHCDAVQAAGKIAIDMNALGADMISLSAHKLGGPQGVGALVLGEGISLGAPLIRGGGQEGSRRAGTENLPGIAGFGAAAHIAIERLGQAGRVARLRDRLEAGFKEIAPSARIFAADALRLPNTSNFGLAGLSAETAVIAFDLAGVAVSSGSACSSGKVTASHVLKAMDVPADVRAGAIRASIGYDTDASEIEAFLAAFAQIVARTRAGVAA